MLYMSLESINITKIQTMLLRNVYNVYNLGHDAIGTKET